MVLGKKKKSQEISHFSLTSSKMKNRKEKKKKDWTRSQWNEKELEKVSRLFQMKPSSNY